MNISYGIHESPFGYVVIGLSEGKIATVTFSDTLSEKKARELIKRDWPKATFARNDQVTARHAKKLFKKDADYSEFDVLIQGTDFQKKVWKQLLRIPKGKTTTYAKIAHKIGSPKAVRAVGTACGKNRIAYLIPCHRVLSSNGKLGGYATGTKRKVAMLTSESAKIGLK